MRKHILVLLGTLVLIGGIACEALVYDERTGGQMRSISWLGPILIVLGASIAAFGAVKE